MDDQLYLLEILVDKIEFSPAILEIPDANQIVVNAEFGKIANLQIRSDDLAENYPLINKSYLNRHVNLDAGKSYLFPIRANDLVNALMHTPLEIMVFKEYMSDPMGVVSIPWGVEFIEMVEKSNTNAELCIPVSKEETHEIFNDALGSVTGSITTFIRLSCFGKNIQTQFQIIERKGAEGKTFNKKYLFKSSNATTTFQAQKFGKEGSSEAISVGPLYNLADPKAWKGPLKAENMTIEELNKSLCKNPHCPAAQKFKEYGIGPASTGKGLGTLCGATDIPISYGLSHTYGTFDNYGPYGLYSRPKRLDEPFIPKEPPEPECTTKAGCCGNCKNLTQNKEKECQSCDPLRLSGGENTEFSLVDTFLIEFKYKSSNDGIGEFKYGTPLRLIGGGANDDDEECRKCPPTPMAMCKDLMNSFDKVLNSYKTALGPCGTAICPFNPTVTSESCKKSCSNPADPDPTKTCHDKCSSGATEIVPTMIRRSMKMGSGKTFFPMPPHLPPLEPIHWDCPDPLPKGPCRNPQCPLKPPELRYNPAMAGACGNPKCPYPMPVSCGSPECPFTQPSPCPYKQQCYPPPPVDPTCGHPRCPFSPNPPCGPPPCPPPPCTNPGCPYATKPPSPCFPPPCSPPPSTCGSPECPFAPKPPPQTCGSPECPFSPKPPPPTCGSPGCPFAPKKPPCSPPPPKPCANPKCPFAPQPSTCENPECPYAPTKKPSPCYIPPPKKDICSNPQCPFAKANDDMCTDPYCPFLYPPTPPSCGHTPPVECQYPNCPFATPEPPADICENPECPYAQNKPRDKGDEGEECDNPECPYATKKPSPCYIPQDTASVCSIPNCPYAKAENTRRISQMAGDQGLEVTTGYRDTTVDTGPCGPKTCYVEGGNLKCHECAKTEGAVGDGKKRKRRRRKEGRKGCGKFKYKLGDLYPGIHIGHKECNLPGRNVPAKMGWLWNVHVPCVGLKPRRGWRPGAVGRTVALMIEAHRRAQRLKLLEPLVPKKKRRRGASDSDSDVTVAPKSTLQIKKRDGCYLITMNPLKDPKTLLDNENPYMDCSPLQFKISKNKDKNPAKIKRTDDMRTCFCDEDEEQEIESSSSDSELDIEFTPPAGIIRPERLRKKKTIVHTDTQYDIYDFTERKPEEAKKGKGKGGKKGKK